MCVLSIFLCHGFSIQKLVRPLARIHIHKKTTQCYHQFYAFISTNMAQYLDLMKAMNSVVKLKTVSKSYLY